MSENNKATILAGREEERGFLSTIFSLCIDGKLIYGFKSSELNGKGYLSNCSSAAEDIAKQMARKGVEEYFIENGKKYNRGEVIRSKAIPTDGIGVFKNTLDARLSYAKLVV